MREHGTNARYHLDGCRCASCTEAANEYSRHMRRMIAYGRWEPYTDAEPARAHCRALMAAGMGPVYIARAAGLPHGAVSKLLYGDYSRGMTPSKRIRHETAAAILAVEATLDTLAGGALVDSTGTVRRVQALACRGWSAASIARRIGRDPVNFPKMLKRTRVQASTARAVRDLYEELSMTLCPDPQAGHTRARAERNGWLPPLTWDDDRIDDPDYTPGTPRLARGYDEAVVLRLLGGEYVASNSDEKREAMRRWVAAGRSERSLCEAHGWKAGRYTTRTENVA